MPKFLGFIILAFFAFCFKTVGQTPPPNCNNTCQSGPNTLLPSQDCQGAISLCKLKYNYPTGAVCGPGRIACEIPGGTCMSSGERHTTWYSFTVRTTGLLEFLIRPLDAVGNNIGQTDYDWAVFKVPSGLNINASTCDQLKFSGPNWVISCNYAGAQGTTGMYDTTNVSPVNNTNAGGSKYNRPLQVNVGETYLLAVDNFSGGVRIGYDIQFTPEGIRGAASIIPEGLEAGPEFGSVQRTPNCADNLFIFNFNQPIRCGNIRPSGFTLKTKLRNTNTVVQSNIQITEFRPASGVCNEAAQQFHLRFSPVRATDELDYWIVLRDTIFDVCGSFTIRDSLMFRISPLVNLLSNNPENQNCQNSSSISLTAQTDTALRIAPAQVSYQWKIRRSNLRYSLIGSEQGDDFALSGTNGSRIQINSANTVNLQNTFFVRLIARTVNGCIDSNDIQVNVSPLGVGEIESGPTCSNDLIRLSYSGFNNSSYQWTVPPEVVIVGNPTLSNISVRATQNGTYTIRVRELSNRGCLGPELTKTITVSAAPVLPALPRNVTLCQSQIVTLGYPEQDSNLRYSWEPAFLFENPSAHRTNIKTDIWGNLTGRLRVTNATTGCVSTDSITIRIDRRPNRPVISPSSNFICNGLTVQLSAPVSAGYRWSNGSQQRTITVSQPGVYTVKVINEFGCESEESNPFTLVAARPAGSVIGPSSVCPGTEGVLYSFSFSGLIVNPNTQWFVENGSIVGPQNNQTVIISWNNSPNSLGRLKVVPFLSTACFGDTIYYEVGISNQLRPLKPSGDSLLCAQPGLKNYGVSPSPNSEYTWFVTNGTIQDGQGSASISVIWDAAASEGEVWFIERNTLSIPAVCEGTSPRLRVRLNQTPSAPPVVTNPTNFCGLEDSIIINFNISPGSTLVFSALSGLTVLSNQNGVVKLRSRFVGNFILRYFERTAINCSSPTGEHRFNIWEPPNASTGGNRSICTNQPLTIGPPTTQANVNYSWTPQTNINSFSVARPIFRATIPGVYKYKLRATTTSNNCFSEDSISITVTPTAAKPQATNRWQFCNTLEGRTISVNANNPNTDFFEWVLPGGLITVGSTSRNTLTIVPLNYGIYPVLVRAMNFEGCPSEYLSDTIVFAPNPSLGTYRDTSICMGSSISFTGNTENNIRYSWEPASLFTNPNLLSSTFNPRDSGTYNIRLIARANNSTCETIRNFRIRVEAVPSLPQRTSVARFCGTGTSHPINLAAEGAGLTYQWQFPSGITIIGASNQNNIQVSANAAGQYPFSVRARNALGCLGPALNDTISISAVPLLQAMRDTALCIGGSLNFNNRIEANTEYFWEPARLFENANNLNTRFIPTDTGNVRVRITARNNTEGCVDFKEFSIRVNPLPATPEIVASGNTTFCREDSVILSAPAGMAGYEWSNGARTQRITVKIAGSYSVRVRNVFGCLSNESATVTTGLYPAPERPTISSLSGNLLCSGEIFRLRASEGLTYRWSNGATSREVNVSGPQRLSVTVFSSEGCASLSSEEVELAYRAELTTSLSENNQFICPEQFEGLSYRVKGGDGSGFSWGVLGGSIMENQGNSIKVNWQTGASLRQVSVVETSSFGCVGAEQTLAIEVDELVNNPASGCEITNYQLGVPNVISPNADGFNDLFELKNLRYYPDLELEIFNRFGKQVAFFKPYNNSFSANALPAGTYFYRIVSGRGQTLKGWLDVVR